MFLEKKIKENFKLRGQGAVSTLRHTLPNCCTHIYAQYFLVNSPLPCSSRNPSSVVKALVEEKTLKEELSETKGSIGPKEADKKAELTIASTRTEVLLPLTERDAFTIFAFSQIHADGVIQGIPRGRTITTIPCKWI